MVAAVAAFALASVKSAWADERVERARPVDVREERLTLPNVPLLVLGGFTFVASYGPSLAIGAQSERAEDKNLFFPVVGPWVDFLQRVPCGAANGRSCDKEALYKGALVVAGAGQVAAVMQIVLAFVLPVERVRTVPPRAGRVRIVPLVSPQQYGLGASGAF